MNSTIRAVSSDPSQTAFGFKAGRMYAPAEVDAGLACECSCFGCGAILVAKKGQKNRWHFAHHKVEIGETCAESAIHAAAKQVLLEQNWLTVPELTIVVSSQAKLGLMMQESSTLCERRTIRFERSLPEVWETNIRPDVVGYRGGKRLLVEMFFRHKVDTDKLRKLSDLKLPSIEIDLADMDLSTGFEAITQRVIHDTSFKSWLFFPNEEEERHRLRMRLAKRIRQANNEQKAKAASDREREATRQRKLHEDRTRREAAAERYRQMSPEAKEQDLRERLGIVGRWPYYLQKDSVGGSAISEKPMIWQAALFARFIFNKANLSYDLKQSLIFGWVLDRFDTGSSSIESVNLEVRRYLGYLCACGFLRKLPFYHHEGQCYVVVHGELAPPKRVEKAKETTNQVPIASRPAPVALGTHEHWIWRASWPKWSEISDEAARLIASSEYGEFLEALLQEICPVRRPSEPIECAELMRVHGVPQVAVMSFLEHLGLVLKSTLPGRRIHP